MIRKPVNYASRTSSPEKKPEESTTNIDQPSIHSNASCNTIIKNSKERNIYPKLSVSNLPLESSGSIADPTTIKPSQIQLNPIKIQNTSTLPRPPRKTPSSPLKQSTLTHLNENRKDNISMPIPIQTKSTPTFEINNPPPNINDHSIKPKNELDLILEKIKENKQNHIKQFESLNATTSMIIEGLKLLQKDNVSKRELKVKYESGSVEMEKIDTPYIKENKGTKENQDDTIEIINVNVDVDAPKESKDTEIGLQIVDTKEIPLEEEIQVVDSVNVIDSGILELLELKVCEPLTTDLPIEQDTFLLKPADSDKQKKTTDSSSTLNFELPSISFNMDDLFFF